MKNIHAISISVSSADKKKAVLWNNWNKIIITWDTIFEKKSSLFTRRIDQQSYERTGGGGDAGKVSEWVALLEYLRPSETVSLSLLSLLCAV